MRITVLGATGATGQQIVGQAGKLGHEVTAVARRTSGNALVADVFDPAAMEPVVAGRDAVISALGARAGTAEPVITPALEAVIKAMRSTGTRRLLVVTASGHVVGDSDDWLTRTLVKPVVGRFLRTQFADFSSADRLIEHSGLDWTILRPPRLTDGGHRPYRTAIDDTVRRGNTISRADLAAETLRAAADPATIGHAVALGY